MHQNEVAERSAQDQAKARAILEQQQKENDELDRHDQEFREPVRRKKAESKANIIGGSKTWTHYIP